MRIKTFFYNILENTSMAAACWASLAVLAGGIATLYALDWYRNRKQIRKPTKRFLTEEDHTTKEAVAEQLVAEALH